MEKLGTLVPQVAARAANRNGSSATLTRSPASSLPIRTSAKDFARAIAALVALKRSADLTELQVNAWYAVLGDFPIEVVNAAIIEVCLTQVRFPEVGDLYEICRREMPKDKYAPLGSGRENERPSGREIALVAQRLGLKVQASKHD